MLEPLASAGSLIQVQAAAALASVGLGAFQFALPKGGRRHRGFGYLWVGLLALVALSSFGIAGTRQAGPFSWIHGLSLFTLATLALAVGLARRRRIEAHRWTMYGLFFGALVVTGLFTLVPGRLMHRVLFG